MSQNVKLSPHMQYFLVAVNNSRGIFRIWCFRCMHELWPFLQTKRKSSDALLQGASHSRTPVIWLHMGPPRAKNCIVTIVIKQQIPFSELDFSEAEWNHMRWNSQKIFSEVCKPKKWRYPWKVFFKEAPVHECVNTVENQQHIGRRTVDTQEFLLG